MARQIRSDSCMSTTGHALKDEDVALFDMCEGVLSIRFYPGEAVDDVLREVVAVYYPESPQLLDVLEVIPKIKMWIDQTDQTMGNYPLPG